MAIETNQKLGGTGTSMAIGNAGAIRPYKIVVDIAKAVADGTFAAGGDQIDIMTLPDGSYFAGIDAEIVEVLVLGTSPTTDIGTTTADPDEYVDGQTDTAVGRFTAYVAASVVPVIIVGEKTLTAEFGGSAPASGKVAVTVWLGVPVTTNFERASERIYPIVST